MPADLRLHDARGGLAADGVAVELERGEHAVRAVRIDAHAAAPDREPLLVERHARRGIELVYCDRSAPRHEVDLHVAREIDRELAVHEHRLRRGRRRRRRLVVGVRDRRQPDHRGDYNVEPSGGSPPSGNVCGGCESL